MSPSEGLEVRGLAAAWEGTPVLREVDLDVAPGEFVVLMGPNGSGKTTLLRCLAGLEAPVAGSVRLAGRDLARVPAHRRGIGMLLQDPALFPHRTVLENIVYGLEVRRVRPAEARARVADLIDLLHLGPFVDRPPAALSGGERQRVALARTLAPRPSLVLLDEPFAAVDAALRAELMGEFRSVLRARGASALHVTHDRDEGLFLGDRVLVLLGGGLARGGRPEELYARPGRADVARFLGFNVLATPDGPVAVAPRELALTAPGAGRIDARVVASGSAGGEAVVHLRADDGRRLELRTALGTPRPARGDRAGITWSGGRPVDGDDPPGAARDGGRPPRKP